MKMPWFNIALLSLVPSKKISGKVELLLWHSWSADVKQLSKTMTLKTSALTRGQIQENALPYRGHYGIPLVLKNLGPDNHQLQGPKF